MAPARPIARKILNDLQRHRKRRVIGLAAVAAIMQQHLEKWLDDSIPALGGKTPRQAVRTPSGRDDVAALLLEQGRLLSRQPQSPSADVRSLWPELGLTSPE